MTVEIKTWTCGVPFEDSARAQVERLATLPIVGPHIAIMPDVHAGIGCVVGSVVPTRAAIIPACCGVDLGCGMIAARTSLTASQLPDTLRALFVDICRAVPHGSAKGRQDVGAWSEKQSAPLDVHDSWQKMLDGYRSIVPKHPKANTKQA